ncbi:MAG: glycoside hydrolase family 5 protein, partial [Bacteroidales bacterium]|nr:glycoside hydrolase family 5 protein [Bacteroidales bacterium]
MAFSVCTPLVHARQPPFSRGVNLTGWFQVPSVNNIHFKQYQRNDFVNIKSLGCNVIRLPINLHFFTYPKPGYILDTNFLAMLDQAVGWAEELELYLILDNHTFDPFVDTDPNIGNILNKVWYQLADRYKNTSNYVIYEILNEPHGIGHETWNHVQKKVVDTIRSIDTAHYIVVGGADWNSYNSLDKIPVYEDKKIIYTFHFYEPFIFTHQGASWTTPSLEALANLPFPYNADSMPFFPESLVGTWVEGTFNQYSSTGLASYLETQIDVVSKFDQERDVMVFCGEFGVYMPNSKNNHRIAWYHTVRNILESHNIAWAIWDYHGGFGIFNNNSPGLFNHNLNSPLLAALGLDAPEQMPFFREPDTIGFIVYDDYVSNIINKHFNYSNELIDYFSTDSPNNGHYCLRWDSPEQYASISFNFSIEKDFSQLIDKDFYVDFMIRGNQRDIALELRFLDTKIDSTDHPWRVGYKLDKNNTVFNN